MAATNANNISFGIGEVYLLSNKDGVITPKRLFGLQDLSINFSGDTAQLQTDSRFPLAIAATGMTVTGSFTLGSLAYDVLAEFIFNAEKQVGSIKDNEVSITLTKAEPTDTTITYQATDYRQDLGVIYKSGAQLERVENSVTLTAGKYKVSDEGLYTFAAADDSQNVYVRFDSLSTTEGDMWVIKNSKMGLTNSFKIETISYYNGKRQGIILNNCIMTSADISKSNTDFTKPAISFSASVDDNDELGLIFVL